MSSRNDAFAKLSADLGLSFDGEIKVGGNYVAALRHDNQVFISGQVPRVGSEVKFTGRVGSELSLDQARQAAQVSIMRAIALLQRSLDGDLGRVKQILRMNVFVQSADNFTQQSEVADAASELLYSLFGSAGTHARTSVGVYQLPKNAAVEIDLQAAVE
jgi:enamine deaminase RidA (YjgF/YER057c/UK114 family)